MKKPIAYRPADGSVYTLEVVTRGERRRPYPWPFPVSVGSDGETLRNVCAKQSPCPWEPS